MDMQVYMHVCVNVCTLCLLCMYAFMCIVCAYTRIYMQCTYMHACVYVYHVYMCVLCVCTGVSHCTVVCMYVCPHVRIRCMHSTYACLCL